MSSNAPRRGLGRGLGSLIPTAPSQPLPPPAASRVRASYIVNKMVVTTRFWFRCLRTMSTVSRSWPRPSRA